MQWEPRWHALHAACPVASWYCASAAVHVVHAAAMVVLLYLPASHCVHEVLPQAE